MGTDNDLLETKTVTLTRAIRDAKGKPTKTVVIKEPIAKDFRVYDQAAGSVEGMQRLIARLAVLPLPSVEGMRGVDYNRCQAAVNGFLADSPDESESDSPSSQSPSGGAPETSTS